MSEASAPQPAHPLRQILIDLAVMSVVGLFLGLIGPFGTIAMPVVGRILSWLAFAYVGYAIYRPMGVVVEWAARRLALPAAGLWVAAVIVATLPMTVAVQIITSLPGPVRWPGIDVITGTYFSVLVIGGAVTLLFNLLKPGQGSPAAAPVVPAYAPPIAPIAASEPPAPPPPPPTNPLLDQLPAELGSAIIALEMEDHYVRIHTALGSALVLMRLRDAMAQVGDLEGMQVHRSWWVARAAVEDVLRDGRNVRLRLARGIEAPVARAKVAELRDARWI
ncbi:LytTR family DNA-binding domain-containing protein [Porphyrobacter sp. YT40]|uniref:LytTR family DNA-binding domain-containing protein n=1 Tax=Porphyrobacter sp. YT40 TaxID=2547601 RepID=UPI0011429B88|nr:LytTR family DNA-binding domain-containing protein [Porphyrobacter sp. YT40]QDH33026.1 LytTR family transcriptional regulator [Porphyrobacter sp. YT40]